MHTITDIPEAWRSVKRILAIRLDNLGDMLLMTPALHAIKESLPGVELSVLAGPVGAQATRLNPDVDDVIVYHSPQMDPWGQLPQDPEREFALIATLRERNFDAAVIFTSFRQSSLPQAYVCYLAGIPLRLAASIDGCGSLLTTRHRHPEHLMHEVERALDLVGAVGFRSNQRDLVLQVPPEARRTAEAWLANACAGAMSRPLIVIHPGCTMPARTYPWQMYSEVADLATSQLNATVVVSGTQDEHELVEQIRNQSRYPLISAAGALAFPEFTALDRNGRHMNLNNTKDFIDFLVLRANSHLIAPSWAERYDSGEYKFAIVFESENLKTEVSKVDEKKKAYAYLGKNRSQRNPDDRLFVSVLPASQRGQAAAKGCNSRMVEKRSRKDY
ncbi:MAG: glycosyltransferase family 9 protein [Chloroflexaceae bacterium]|nr:glycosyltransferase family 9 protein [Chloroflexaceae bacterium]